MIFKNYGNPEKPWYILIHGGFLGEWSLRNVVSELKEQYFVVTPELQGHGDDIDSLFIGIEQTAKIIINHIEKNCKSRVAVIGGFSVGAQVTSEILMQDPNISEYAVIESGCENRIPVPKSIVKLMFKIKNGKFYKSFLDDVCPLPQEMIGSFNTNYSLMSKETLINTAYNNFVHRSDKRLAKCQAKVLIMYGSDEPNVMKRAAIRMNKIIPKSCVFTVHGFKHGGISIWNPKAYSSLVQSLEKIDFKVYKNKV